MNASEYWKLKKSAQPSKFKNKKENYAGRSFDSKGEAECFRFLELQQKAGLIRDLMSQQTVYMTDARISYRADYRFFDVEIDELVWGEFKGGFESDVWRIKRRLWKAGYGPGILRVYKARYRKGSIEVFLAEEIFPRIGKSEVDCEEED